MPPLTGNDSLDCLENPLAVPNPIALSGHDEFGLHALKRCPHRPVMGRLDGLGSDGVATGG